MQKETPPKKPLTPFFMYREDLKEKGITVGSKEAGERWKKLTDAQRKPYTDKYKKAKEKYDRYLEEEMGITAKSSSKAKEKPTCFKTARMRAVCGRSKLIGEISQSIYKGIGRVLVILCANNNRNVL